MAVISYNYHPDSGGISGSGQSRTASVSYIVELDSPLASEYEAEYHTPVYLGQPYDHHGVYIGHLRASSFSAERAQRNTGVWRVDVEYSTSPPDRDAENPLNDPPVISGGTTTVEVPVLNEVDHDWDQGAILTNSAGQPIDPPPTKKQPVSTLSITRNEPLSSNPRRKAPSLTGAVNNSAWGEYKKGEAQIAGISYSQEWHYPEQGEPWSYWNVTYSIEGFPGGHQLSIVDKGDYYRENGEEKDFLTAEGNPYVGLLDGNGGKSGSPVFLEKQIYPEIAFSSLNLPV